MFFLNDFPQNGRAILANIDGFNVGICLLYEEAFLDFAGLIYHDTNHGMICISVLRNHLNDIQKHSC